MIIAGDFCAGRLLEPAGITRLDRKGKYDATLFMNSADMFW
jgi:hypothetical protein